MKNIDKIRNMSVEEIAEMFAFADCPPIDKHVCVLSIVISVG